VLGRDLLAISFLRWISQPIFDVWYEPLGGNQIPHGMVIVLRMTAPKNSAGHLAIEQDGGKRVTFRHALGDRSQRPVGLASDLTKTPVHQVRSDIGSEFGEQRQGLMNIGISAGSRDRPLASLGDDVLRQSAKVFVENSAAQARPQSLTASPMASPITPSESSARS
jgi:hypothetical protein